MFNVQINPDEPIVTVCSNGVQYGSHSITDSEEFVARIAQPNYWLGHKITSLDFNSIYLLKVLNLCT
jgi:hypothetical protein